LFIFYWRCKCKTKEPPLDSPEPQLRPPYGVKWVTRHLFKYTPWYGGSRYFQDQLKNLQDESVNWTLYSTYHNDLPWVYYAHFNLYVSKINKIYVVQLIHEFHLLTVTYAGGSVVCGWSTSGWLRITIQIESCGSSVFFSRFLRQRRSIISRCWLTVRTSTRREAVKGKMSIGRSITGTQYVVLHASSYDTPGSSTRVPKTQAPPEARHECSRCEIWPRDAYNSSLIRRIFCKRWCIFFTVLYIIFVYISIFIFSFMISSLIFFIYIFTLTSYKIFI
jgi:hypothetical protein